MLIDFKASDIDSSNIKRVEFRNEMTKSWSTDSKGYVRITFKNDSRYIYKDVPFIEVINMITSESVGSFFNRVISKNYSFVKQ